MFFKEILGNRYIQAFIKEIKDSNGDRLGRLQAKRSPHQFDQIIENLFEVLLQLDADIKVTDEPSAVQSHQKQNLS